MQFSFLEMTQFTRKIAIKVGEREAGKQSFEHIVEKNGM